MALQLRGLRQVRNNLRSTGNLEIYPADYAADEVRAIRQIEKEAGILDTWKRLHQDSALDASLCQMRRKVRRQEVAVDGGKIRRRPLTATVLQQPEMLVSIDHHGFRQLQSVRRRI
jgi:hypothetical protein